jgi:hypothetical protein
MRSLLERPKIILPNLITNVVKISLLQVLAKPQFQALNIILNNMVLDRIIPKDLIQDKVQTQDIKTLI